MGEEENHGIGIPLFHCAVIRTSLGTVASPLLSVGLPISWLSSSHLKILYYNIIIYCIMLHHNIIYALALVVVGLGSDLGLASCSVSAPLSRKSVLASEECACIRRAC